LQRRFEGGLVVEMQSPCRGLREKLYADYLNDVETPERGAVIAYLADRSASSVREIIGTVNRVVAAAELAHSALTLAAARAELDPGAVDPGAPNVRAADAFFLDDEKIV